MMTMSPLEEIAIRVLATTRLAAAPPAAVLTEDEQVDILKTWFTNHYSRPYPTNEERDALVVQTGMNVTQVVNWFANRRRRHWGKKRKRYE